jgi:hypothetical protein
MSQTQQILNHLKQAKPLTGLEALDTYGCFRLAARVQDIENMGYVVSRRNIKVGGKRVTEYLSARRAKKNG